MEARPPAAGRHPAAAAQALETTVAEHLQHRRSVILEAVAEDRLRRRLRALTAQHGGRPLEIECVLSDPDEHHRRLAARTEGERFWRRVLATLETSYRPPDDCLRIETHAPADELAQRVMAHIATQTSTDDAVAKPTVYMLCGFVASGKTTYSRKLEAEGAVRLSIDEAVFDRYGRHAVDYPEHEYPTKEAQARGDLDRQLVQLIRSGRSVVLDYGFWSRAARDRYKQLIEQAGGRWRLLYFPTSLEVVRERVKERNLRTDANALTITDEMLHEFLTRWQPPEYEGQERVGAV